MAIVYGLTLFLSAALLFAVQPMVGRLLLPKLGGSPAVWNTCLVFFQGMLLLGYLYSHVLPRWFGVRRHAMVHVLLLSAVWLTLPITLRGGDPPTGQPAMWLLLALCVSVGVPFFALATTSPLLQLWYAFQRGRDPYFLSIASNAGSLAILLSYPFIVEPRWGLEEQASHWRWVYLAFVGLVLICVVTLRTSATTSHHVESAPSKTPGPAWRWVLLGMIPSSLLSGVTYSITTDVAPIPLLWLVPLALYLLTFIIAFAPITLPMVWIDRLAILGTITLSLAMLAGATEPLGLVLGIHLVGFFSLALLCHARLSQERPSAERLTQFYLLMSFGGVLGGAFNALVGPFIFHRLGMVEYPLMVVAACCCRPAAVNQVVWRRTDVIAPVILGGIVAGMILLGKLPILEQQITAMAENLALPAEMLKSGIFFGGPLIICYFFVDRPLRFGAGIAAVMLAGTLNDGAQGKLLLIERNFLGVVKITSSPDGEFTRMVHGNTVHGQQRNTPRLKWIATQLHAIGNTHALHCSNTLAILDERGNDRTKPLTYYHPNGPAGSVFRWLTPQWRGERQIAVVGLGTGALASYARPNETWTFFELDPTVEKLARDARFFTYLRDSRAAQLQVTIGDARLKLAERPDHSFDLLVLDAFASDAIPLHLLTTEAFAMYQRKLKPSGLILLHLSNRYLDLAPMVGKITNGLPTPLIMRVNDDLSVTDQEKADGKYPSIWVLLTEHEQDLGPLTRPIRGWLPSHLSPAPAWTDTRSNLLDVLRRPKEDD